MVTETVTMEIVTTHTEAEALLNHFGSARGVKMAGLTDLEAVPGINKETARRVYAHFHPGARVAAG